MKHLLLAAKILFIAGLIAFAAFKFDPAAAAKVLASADMRYAAPSLLFAAASLLFSTLRWGRLIRGAWPGTRFGAGRLLYFNLLAQFYSLFIPTSVAGETVRALKLAGAVESARARSISSVLFDRLLGVLTWLLIFLAAPTPFGAKKYLLFLPLALFAAVAARKKLVVCGRELLDLSRHHAGDLAMALCYSLAGQLMAILANYAAFRCFAADLAFAQVTGITATAALAGIVPLSLLGISAREGTLLGLLPLYGASPTQSVFIVTFFVFTNYLFGLLGGALELARSGRRLSRAPLAPEQKTSIE